MVRLIRRTFLVLFILAVTANLTMPLCYAAAAKEIKIGYVDLRKAFYEYKKTQTMENELNGVTDKIQQERTKKIEEITKLRGEVELLNGDAKNKKQADIDAKIADLQEYDKVNRQKLFNQKNDMFKEIVDDIQKIVNGIGEKDKYDYILDSRNIMYANNAYDLTQEVLKQLNK
ncbi:MAG: OmpH family outer membrane protein [Candidatus Omnitrophica bacterium]|nr:OmpH family outer membrane protein [Candidatus Omnitrophota bacterium]